MQLVKQSISLYLSSSLCLLHSLLPFLSLCQIVEKLVFAFLLALVVVMVTWVSGMVLGRQALPLAAASYLGKTCHVIVT